MLPRIPGSKIRQRTVVVWDFARTLPRAASENPADEISSTMTLSSIRCSDSMTPVPVALGCVMID